MRTHKYINDPKELLEQGKRIVSEKADTKAQQDQADGSDQGKDEIAQIRHDLQGIVAKAGAIMTAMDSIRQAKTT